MAGMHISFWRLFGIIYFFIINEFLAIWQVETEDESKEGDEWEFVEEGPAEIIWQGNEIIVKKKKVRVAKKDVDRQSNREVLLYYFC